MWTPPALASEARPWSGDIWRVVESQSKIATLKLVDTLDEQAILEAELEGSKPLIPASCAGLDYLLATPFRYAPYRQGSRFRRARQPDGCFYAAERVEPAVAEEAFYRLLFFLDAPAAKRPANPQERTAFRVPAGTGLAIDLTAPPLDRDAAIWGTPPTTARAKHWRMPRGSRGRGDPLPVRARPGRRSQPRTPFPGRLTGDAAGGPRDLARVRARGLGASDPGDAPNSRLRFLFAVDGGPARAERECQKPGAG